MKNISWQQIQPGQIIKFTYKSMGSNRGIHRNVLVIDPRYRYKKKSTGRIVEFLVGLQLDTFISAPINKIKFEKLIKQMGGLSLDKGVVEVGSLPNRVAYQKQTQEIYETLKLFLQKEDIFRTFFLRECRKRRVFLIDSYNEFPKDSTQRLLKEQKIQNLIKKTEDLQ